jgi:D-beta-D-heptose 7-phosphate kinase/D-beta-D-heptose 1-phosphate adenosyltransferase
MSLESIAKRGQLNFDGIKIAVIGDCMLDIYHYGKVERISPEAPVPIFRISNKEPEYRLGGACNTVLNLSKIGVQATLFGFVGKDMGATYIKTYLLENNIKYHLFDVSDFPTITKNRYFAKNQQIIRIDREYRNKLIYDIDNQNNLIEVFKNTIINSFDLYDAIIFSDYGKGTLHYPVLHKIKEECQSLFIPIFIDPKINDWEEYKGVFCITPNWEEFKQICNQPNLATNADINEIAEYGGAVCRKYELEYLLVTRGSQGLFLVDKKDDFIVIGTQAKEVYDVSGAGDTVIAVFAAAYAKKFPLDVAMELANLAAKVVVGKLGTYAITNSELNYELLNYKKERI